MALIVRQLGLLARAAHREQLHLLLLLLCLWMPPALYWSSGPIGSTAVFVLGAATLPLLLLRACGVSRVLYLVPRWPDSLTLLLAVLAGALTTNLLLQAFTSFEFCQPRWCPLWLILTLALAITVGTFTVDLFISRLLQRHGLRRRVILDLLPAEQHSFWEDLIECGLHSQVACLSRRDLTRILKQGDPREIDLIVISRKAVQAFDRDALLVRAHLHGVRIVDSCALSCRLTGKVKLPETCQWEFLADALPQTALRRIYRLLGQFCEPPLAVALLVLFAPLMLIIAAAVKYSSLGPVIYRQMRLGFLGRPFALLKFRTMNVEAESG
jgi:hypothetical protein